MKSSLPKGWKIYRVEEALDKIIDYRGRTPKKSESGIATLSARSVKNNYIDFKKVYYISKEEYDNFMTRGFPEIGDVVLTTEAPLGLVTQLRTKNIALGQRILTIRGKKDLVDNGYLKYFFQSSIGQHELDSRATGTTVMGISQKNFRECNIILPHIKEQKAIADTLSALDNKIELNNKINENLEEQAQAIFKHWFVDFEFPEEDDNPYKSSGGQMIESELGMIPKGWEVVEFQDIIEFTNGYGFKSKEVLDSPLKDGYKVFKMGDIKVGGGLNSDKTKSWISLDYLTENKLEKYLAKKGDLLMCMTDMKNSMKLLGHTALMPFGDEYVVNQRVGHIRENNDVDVSYPYLYILTNNDNFIEDLRGRSNSGVQVNLTTSAIKETKITVGSKDINLYFDNTIRPMIEKIFSLENQNQKLSQLRDTLLPKLMSGEIRIPLD